MREEKKQQNVLSSGCPMTIYPPLPLLELLSYTVVTLGVIGYITFCVLRSSLVDVDALNPYDFEPGWSFLDRKKDISNFEWRFWYELFLAIYPWYIGHVILGKLAEWTFSQYRKVAFIVYSLICLSNVMGWRIICLIFAHSFISFVSSKLKSKKLVWIVSLFLLTTLNFEPGISWIKSLTDDKDEEQTFYLFIFALALSNIRYTSFALEKCGAVDDKTSTRTESDNQEYTADSLVDLALYIFYLPLFFTGPILTYDLFSKQFAMKLKWTKERIVLNALNILRMLFWALLNELLLHYLYFGALQQNRTVVASASLYTVAGIGYWQGQFFMNKYLVMFGLPSNIAKIDNFDPPKGPKCIAYIYLYSDMWKYFDCGLYRFLKRYIYVPLGGSQAGLLWQTIGSVCCFVFIFYWHGAEYYIFLWVLLNFVGVTMEGLGKYCSKLPMISKFQTETISPVSVRRLHAALSVPIFLTSAFAIFCFFGGHDVGYVFFIRLIIEGWPVSWLSLSVFLYCPIQIAMEINRRQMLKQKTS
ncbi:hypothetical protein ScPMuIL_013551 [Solemya velum]